MTEDTKSTEVIQLENDWLIRSCEVYADEYSDCRSIKARFNQYFIFGKSIDCSQWKHDADNCYKWVDKQDYKAAKELIESEKLRRIERLKAHYGNNVWVRRKNPPEDWAKPLPEEMQKEYENSYLDIKNREMKGELKPVLDTTSCVLM